MLDALDRVIKNIKPKYDEDAVDRLNYFYTSGLFVLLIVVLSAKQYVGEPLQCWMSPEFRGDWERYIESYCFVENTYYVSFQDTKLPENDDGRRINYYQWVPIVLILQLFLFLMPKTFWGSFSWKSNIHIRGIIGNVGQNEKQRKIMFRHKNHCDKHCEARQAGHRLREMIKYNRNEPTKFIFTAPRQVNSMYLTVVYMCYKVLNCVNTLLQLFVMNKFLNTSYAFWGFGVLRDTLSGRDWKSSGHFPRVTYCDFMRRDDTNSEPMDFTVQCVLMINMFYEKLFIILWFWFVILSICNILNLVYWLVISIIPEFRTYFIESQLSFGDKKHDENEVRGFINNWLSIDGITTLRLVALNAGDLVSSEVVQAMYQEYLKEGKKVQHHCHHEMPLVTEPLKKPHGREAPFADSSGRHHILEISPFSVTKAAAHGEAPPLPPKKPVTFGDDEPILERVASIRGPVRPVAPERKEVDDPRLFASSPIPSEAPPATHEPKPFPGTSGPTVYGYHGISAAPTPIYPEVRHTVD